MSSAKRSYPTTGLEATPQKIERLEAPRKSIYCQHPARNLNEDFNTGFECPCQEDEYRSFEYPHPPKCKPTNLNLAEDYEYINDDGTYALTIDDAEKFVKAGYHVEDVCMQEMDPKMLENHQHTNLAEGIDVIEYPLKIDAATDVQRPIDEGLKRYDAQLKKEWHVIGESIFPLNRSRTKFINIGLSPSLEFAPIIKIRGGRNCVIFTTEQFKELVELRKNIAADNIVIGDHRIYKTTYMEKPVYKFECRDSNITLALDTYKKLHDLAPFIIHKLKVLELIDFPTFYRETLHKCVNLNNGLDFKDKMFILILSEFAKDYKTSLLLEALHLTFSKLSLDYELIKLYSKN